MFQLSSFVSADVHLHTDGTSQMDEIRCSPSQNSAENPETIDFCYLLNSDYGLASLNGCENSSEIDNLVATLKEQLNES